MKTIYIMIAAVTAILPMVQAQGLEARLTALEHEVYNTKSTIVQTPPTPCSLPQDNNNVMLDIEFFHGKYIATPATWMDQLVYTSVDGINFDKHKVNWVVDEKFVDKKWSVERTSSPYLITIFNDKLYAITEKSAHGRIVSSSDGITWEVVSDIDVCHMRKYEDYLFAIGRTTNKTSRIFFSTDGKDFTEIESPAETGHLLYDMAYLNGTLVTWECGNTIIHRTTDFGKNWYSQRYGANPLDPEVDQNELFYSQGFGYADNKSIVIPLENWRMTISKKKKENEEQNPKSYPPYLLVSTDGGETFERKNTPYDSLFTIYHNVGYHNGLWYVISRNSSDAIVSTDLENWTTIPLSNDDIGIRFAKTIRNRLYIMRDPDMHTYAKTSQLSFIELELKWSENSNKLATKKSLETHISDSSHVTFLEKARWDGKPDLPIDYSKITNTPKVITEEALNNILDERMKQVKRIDTIQLIALAVCFVGLLITDSVYLIMRK